MRVVNTNAFIYVGLGAVCVRAVIHAPASATTGAGQFRQRPRVNGPDPRSPLHSEEKKL